MMPSAGDLHDMSSRSGSQGDGNLTGRVGTALYVSPEMMIKQNKGTYSQVCCFLLQIKSTEAQLQCPAFDARYLIRLGIVDWWRFNK
jgi:hypothetical protein